MQTSKEKKKVRPAQKQTKQPGNESKMTPAPEYDNNYKGSNKLTGKIAVITGGDSGIGRAVAVAFAKEGADVVIIYLNEHNDAKKTKKEIDAEGSRCTLISGDVGNESFCKKTIKKIIKEFNKIDILVNNSAVQYPQKSIEKITKNQLYKTFETNIFSMFYLVRESMPFMSKGSTIINTTSVTAYRGSKELIDYSSTKGAIVSFTRSLAASLIDKGIRVNGVAPGPIWTPLIPSSFDKKKVEIFGSDVPMGRAGQPNEVAPCYVFLASQDSSYFTGQILHPNGGEIVNG